MFHSARLRLTLFYLAILLCFSLVLTTGVRELAQHEFNRSNTAQGGAVRQLYRYFDKFSFGPTTITPPEQDDFMSLQKYQDNLVRQHLNEDLLLLNLGALVVGGLLSYWYAGRTLRPIVAAHDAQKRFASDASHELRTPLANMQVENEVFLRQKSFSENEARELIKSNLEEVARLESLASNLLSLTQYENAALKLEPVAVRGITEEALQHAAKPLEARKVKTKQQLAAAKIMGNRESLGQLLTIIIDNAIKYGPEKGVVTITGAKDANRYVLQVRDQGPGIAEADMPHIFDRLYRGDKARSSEIGGYGLGLALAVRIAAANHASVGAANAKEGGAIFTLEFELAK